MTTPTVIEPVTTTSETPTYESLPAGITDPGGREVLDPATGEVVGRVADRTADHLDRAVAAAAAARAAQPAWAARTDADRVGLLLRAWWNAVEAAAELPGGTVVVPLLCP